MPTETATHPNGGPSTPKRTTASTAPAPTLQRLRSGDEAASTLQSSAVAAIGSIRTLASISSSGTSLHPIAPKRAIKVVLIGDGGCGKTSIRNRFLTNTFFPSYCATIGADFITKTLPLDPANPDGEKATLQIWDTAGQERFQSLGSAFYRGADAVIIAFDATKGQEGLDRIKTWYEAFMDKAPGPSDESARKRFCWICAANKVDLIQEGVCKGVDRGVVQGVLDGLVGRPDGQMDYGADVDGVSGAEEPANPVEVLSRPDPNGVEAVHTPDSVRRQQSSSRGGGEATPVSLKNQKHEDASPTPASRRKSTNYRLSRKSLSSIAAAAAKSAQTDDTGDVDDVNANGGTVKTLFATPYSTLNNKQKLSSSPQPADIKSDSAAGGAGGSGFLSSWMRSKTKTPGTQRGHHKRQSIKSIEVFQISDQEGSDVSDSGGATSSSPYAFPSRRKSGAQQTPPRSVLSASTARDRQRVDSTMSLNAPSVYHTPRGSTFFSVSPTPRTTLGVPSRTRTQSGDGSVKGLSVGSSSSLQLAKESGGKLKHKPSIASSSSAITVKPMPKTSHNIDRMFTHILHRVVASTTYEQAQHDNDVETPSERDERLHREQELMRRTIRLASGKSNDRWFGCFLTTTLPTRTADLT
ncbi:hypothetical protein [Sporisorium scitamineum]|uniref:Uncharacterized protein n=1 Tax=Sporisorium scitamineum TaxID=49012 RepID=A0A0F7RWR4_9BASI|nr:hypothetical protein [Sporisorium scitamineum]